jgi:hypothetical protein
MTTPAIPIPQTLLGDIARLNQPSTTPHKKISKPKLPSLSPRQQKNIGFFLPASEPPNPNPTKHIPELEKRARELELDTSPQRWGINVDALPPELRVDFETSEPEKADSRNGSAGDRKGSAGDRKGSAGERKESAGERKESTGESNCLF